MPPPHRDWNDIGRIRLIGLNAPDLATTPDPRSAGPRRPPTVARGHGPGRREEHEDV